MLLLLFSSLCSIMIAYVVYWPWSIGVSTIHTYAWLKQLSHFIHIYTYTRRKRKERSSINYILCHNMNECQPAYKTNRSWYASRSMSSISLLIDDWLMDYSLNKSCSFLLLTITCIGWHVLHRICIYFFQTTVRCIHRRVDRYQ
jgi:hypothetical protein